MENPKLSLFFFVFAQLILTLLPLTIYFSLFSPSPAPQSNITLGSSLSPSSHLLSPAGTFAFGFFPSSSCYEEHCQQYKIGIWINKPAERTLVWSAHLYEDGVSIDHSASILLNHDGVFLVRQPGIPDRHLFFNLTQPASYASMQDNGNFVIYDSNSNILWQSFEYPTDTILSGQTLNSDNSMFSNMNQLPFYDRKLVLQNEYSTKYKEASPIAIKLDSTGRLYLVDSSGLITKNLTEGEELLSTDPRKIYSATLGPDGYFRLYAEIIGGESVELWHSYCSTCQPAPLYYFGTHAAQAIGSSGRVKLLQWWHSYASTSSLVVLYTSGVAVLIAVVLFGTRRIRVQEKWRRPVYQIVMAAIMVMCAVTTYKYVSKTTTRALDVLLGLYDSTIVQPSALVVCEISLLMAVVFGVAGARVARSSGKACWRFVLLVVVTVLMVMCAVATYINVALPSSSQFVSRNFGSPF